MTSPARVAIIGIGSYLPEKILTNDDMTKIVETSNEWIVTRTGILERHIAKPDEAASHMGAEAARRALADAGRTAADVDLILVATITPDMIFPSTACLVQEQIQAKRAVCMDLEAACSGFLYAIETGMRFIQAGGAKTVLVIGAEKLSSITDWQDRTTCVLFGDGAGAVVLEAAQGENGVLSTVLGADGALAELLKVSAGGSRHPATHATVDQRLHYLAMNGREVFKHAVTRMSEAAGEAMKRAGITLEDVHCIIPHQANIRIIQAIAERLGVGLDRFHNNLERVGNMSAASIPVALDEACRIGRVKQGDVLLFVAFGGGFTWGASVLKWGK